MAQAALYLASAKSSAVTGAEFVVDGGITAAYVTPGSQARWSTEIKRRPTFGLIDPMSIGGGLAPSSGDGVRSAWDSSSWPTMMVLRSSARSPPEFAPR